MIKRKPTYDVFVSHSARDTEFSVEVARILGSHGLTVFVDADIAAGDVAEEAIWDAMAESQAMVAVISESEPSARSRGIGCSNSMEQARFRRRRTPSVNATSFEFARD